MFDDLIAFIQDLYRTKDTIPLHEPFFEDEEKKFLIDVIESTFVSSVGTLVGEFEERICEFTGSKFAIATVNGTAALHTALLLSGVQENDEVVTQSLTFVATSNAINYCRAKPIFLDVDLDTLGLSPLSLSNFLNEKCELRDDGFCWNKKTNRIIRACIPMHTFGLSCKIEKIKTICTKWNIKVVEDAAESIGTVTNDMHTGTIGDFGILSFNGNKIITTGGGGMILLDDQDIARQGKHITTTAKIDHQWQFNHDLVGYNYRMPNLNAALGLPQINKLSRFVDIKRKIALAYQEWGTNNGYDFVSEAKDTKSNYWLNTILLSNKKERDILLSETNRASIMTRPVWTPMHLLPFNTANQRDDLKNTEWLADRIVNLPSSIPKDDK